MPPGYNETRKIVFHKRALRGGYMFCMSRTIGVVAGQSDKSRTKNSSLLQKEGSAFRDKQLLEALARWKMYRDYERTFTEATSDLRKFSLRRTSRSEFADFL